MPKEMMFAQSLGMMASERAILLLILGLLVLIFCYIPGLSGGFLLDDFGTLNQLGDLNRIDSFEKLKHFIFSGVTGPGGRPISLLTFAFNAQTWPADPFPFLVTNVALHILNSVLCYVFISQLIPKKDVVKNSYIKYVPVLIALMWALHPMQVATVLYVVQRMTMLAALFCFISLITFIKARNAFGASRNLSATAYLAISGLSFIAGYYSKENILVLFPLLLLIESYFRNENSKSKSRLYDGILLICVLPCALVVLGYPIKLLAENLHFFYKNGSEPYHGRSYTMMERLLTEQRVIGDYIRDILIPKLQTSGVFYDGYPISKNLFNPPQTFIWLLAHIGILTAGICLRKKYNFIFFGIGWFYICHVLESTTPMLEIKFDHRNYMALLGPAFILFHLVSKIHRPVLSKTITLSVLCICAAFLYYSSSLWGNPLKASKIWVMKNPGSIRANEYAAKMAYDADMDEAEVKKYLKSAINLSKSSESELKYIAVFCDTYNGEEVNWDDLSRRIAAEPPNWALFGTIRSLTNKTIQGRCDLLDYDAMSKISEAYRSNPGYSGNLSSMVIEQYEIQMALYNGRIEEAKEIDLRTNEELLPLAYKMTRAQIFASNGMQNYAVQRLTRGLLVARRLLNESDFTISNAEEVLVLISRDIEE